MHRVDRGHPTALAVEHEHTRVGLPIPGSTTPRPPCSTVRRGGRDGTVPSRAAPVHRRKGRRRRGAPRRNGRGRGRISFPASVTAEAGLPSRSGGGEIAPEAAPSGLHPCHDPTRDSDRQFRTRLAQFAQTMHASNLFEAIPPQLPDELVEVLAEGQGHVRIVRLVSRATPRSMASGTIRRTRIGRPLVGPRRVEFRGFRQWRSARRRTETRRLAPHSSPLETPR